MAENADYNDIECKVLQGILVGDKMKDGTIYAGLSPDTGKPMYVTPEDAPLKMKWEAAMKYAARLSAHGHKDWTLPSKSEIMVLFKNRAALGGFHTKGVPKKGFKAISDFHWTATNGPIIGVNAWSHRFSDSYCDWAYKRSTGFIRPVRMGAAPPSP